MVRGIAHLFIVLYAGALAGLLVFGCSERLVQSVSLHHGDVQDVSDDDFPASGLPPVDVVPFASGEVAVDFEFLRDGSPYNGLVGDFFDSAVYLVEVGICLRCAPPHQCVFINLDQ